MTIPARKQGSRLAAYLLTLLVCMAGAMTPLAYAGSIVISEIMYHSPSGADSASSDFEFVEVYNAGTVSKDLSGYAFTNGIDYSFPEGIELPVGAYLVVVGNQQQFNLRYPDVRNIAPGAYTLSLANDGETLTLVNAVGTEIFSVAYNDGRKWPQRADGHGASLMLIDPDGDPDAPENWCASDMLYGTPGESGQCAVSDVVINEVLTHSDPPFEDAIELQNITADPINIGGWYLSDDAQDRKKYRIPSGTTIQEYGGFRVFYEYQFNDSQGDSPFALSSVNGDEVYLTATNFIGNLTRFVDMIAFEAAENGVSFGQSPDGTGPLVTLAEPTFGISNPISLSEFRAGGGGYNSQPKIGPIIISEVMYHPPDIGDLDNSGEEYIELHNITDQPVQLFDPDNPSITWKLASAVDFVFPGDVTIPVDGYILIVGIAAGDIDSFRTTYGLDGTVPIYGPWDGKLDNSDDSVRLYKPDTPEIEITPYILVDRVDYSDSHPWPSGPDGEGYSLERRTPPGLGNDSTSWQASMPGGSPGKVNRSAPPQPPALFINEFSASNNVTCATDEDWIEIYNPNEQAVDIAGFYLTDDLDDSKRWEISEGIVVDAQGFSLFLADGTDTGNHTNFNLSAAGEAIGLFSPEGILVDSVTFGAQKTDVSSGRRPDGYDAWFFFDETTCGATNGTSTGRIVVESPDFSLPPGYYTGEQILALSTETPGAVIRFTLDGSEPDEQSTAYQAPVAIQSRTGDANVFSAIPTNADPGWMPLWRGPSGEVFKATVVRARAFVPNQIPSEIITRTYFVDPGIFERYPTLAVISLVSDRKHLFDDAAGIYVPGNLHIPGKAGSGNYSDGIDPATGNRWEKPAHIEFFEPDGDLGFSQNLGIRIQGNTSQWGPQKGLHAIARSQYGKSRIDYPIFETSRSKANKRNRFKRFVIRSWGGRRPNTLLTDAHAQVLMAESDLDIVDYRPAIVFINGEYWGLHELREFNKSSWYYQYHYGIDRDDPGFDLIEAELQYTNDWGPKYVLDEGDLVHWTRMMGQIQAEDADMSDPVNFDYIKTQMDLDNLLDYVGHSVFIAKWDWPNHNEGFWRPRTADGRWRWFQYDMEALLAAREDSFDDLFSGYWIYLNPWGWLKFGPHPVVIGLSNFEKEGFSLNRRFLDPLINWFADHMNTNLSPEFAVARLDEMVAQLQPYMPEYRERWQLNYDWDARIQEMRSFFHTRPGYMRGFIVSFFDFITGTAALTISDPGNGSVRINQITINEETPGITNLSYPWTGTYFTGVPIELTAIPDEDYQFVRWQGATTAAENPITIDVTGNTAITAIFEKFLPDDPVVNDRTVTTDEDIPKVIDLSATDVGSEEWTYAIVSSPADGILSGTPPAVTYTPADDYNGSDTFTFKANSGYADSNIATITVTIRAVNDAPMAYHQAATTDEDPPIEIDLPATDVDSSNLTYTIASSPTHGTISGPPPAITYTPAADYNGSDTFTFAANDGAVDSNTATITVTIRAVNDAPIADDLAVATAEDIAKAIDLPVTDIDSTGLTYTIVSSPTHGTISGTSLAITYTPDDNFNGSDTFTFTANDGIVDSNPAIISVSIDPVNDAPTIGGAPTILAGTDRLYAFTPTADDVDDEDLLIFRIDNGPAWAVFDDTTGTLSGTPGSGDIGIYSGIVITVVDGSQAEASLAFDLRITDAGILGDVNGDTLIDEMDLLQVVDFIFGEQTPTEQEYISANIDTSNPSIDISDLLGLIDIIQN